jgi:hypothetical protein
MPVLRWNGYARRPGNGLTGNKKVGTMKVRDWLSCGVRRILASDPSEWLKSL